MRKKGLVPSNVPASATNRGIMDAIREQKVGGPPIEADKSQRPRFYSDYRRLGWKCTTRNHPEKSDRILVYRIQ